MVMKKSRKLLVAIMTIAMAATMLVGLTANAAGEGKITITAPANLYLDKQTYTAYRIFDVVYNEDQTKFSYSILAPYDDFDDYPNSATQSLTQYLSSLDDDSAALNALATNLWDFIVENRADIDPLTVGSKTAVIGDTSVVIDGLELGYYLVYGTGLAKDEFDDAWEGTVVAACALTTTVPTASVKLKADVPTIDKFIWNHHEGEDRNDDDDDGWIKWNDVSIGDIVHFRFDTKVPNMIGYTSYTFNIHDRMSPGLDFDSTSVVVRLVNPTTGATKKVLVSKDVNGVDYDYELTLNGTDAAGYTTFSIIFKPSVFITYDAGDIIYVNYSATLNEKAIVGPAGNDNLVRLEYSRSPLKYDENGDEEEETDFTPWRRVKVYTGVYGFIKVEYDEDDEIIATLEGAEFELWREKGGVPEQVWFAPFRTEVIGGKTVRVYKVADEDTINKTDRLVTPDSGIVYVEGLGASYTEFGVDNNGDDFIVSINDGYGKYWMREKKAPDGYFPRTEDIPVQLLIYCEYDGELLDNLYKDTMWRIAEGVGNNWLIVQSEELLEISNEAGDKFPETGGSGRQAFIIGGVALMGLAVVGLVVATARKKKKIVTD